MSSDCYYFYLLEEPMTSDGGFAPGSACFVLDMYSAPGSNGVLPAGEYVLDDSMDPGVFNASNSAFTIYDEEEPVAVTFTDGTISVSTDGVNYTVDINVTGDDGESYHAVYNGPLDFGGGEPGAGYDYVLTESMYEFIEGYGYGGEDNYYLLLSDMPLEDGGIPSYGSTTYALDFYVEAGSTSGYELPEGTYPLGAPYATEAGTIGADYTYFYQFTDVETELYFTEGSVDVSRDGDIYTIEGNLTDTEGNAHHFTYTGAAFPEPAPLPESIEVDATVAGAAYVGDSDGVMEAILQLTDIIPDDEGYLYPPGTVVALDAFMPYDEEGRIVTGTYNVGDSNEAFSLSPGNEILAMYGLGTYVADAPDAQSGFSQYYVSSGTVEISGSFETGYIVSCDFMTEEGVAVKCTYEGKIQIAGMPGPVSTLTGDYELALDGATGAAYYYGDYFGVGGGNWIFAIDQPAGGDGVQVDLVVDGLDFENGIPTGTYTASAEPYPGKFMEGYIDDNYLSGTWYTPTNASGDLTGYAPAMEGTIDIVNNGDGSYDVTFDCTDDLGNVWRGSWSGEVDAADYSYPMTASTKSGGSVKAYAAYPAKGAKTVEEKAEIVKSLPQSDNRRCSFQRRHALLWRQHGSLLVPGRPD